MLSSVSAIAADFSMNTNQSSTLVVEGCAIDEVGYPSLNTSPSGIHTLTAKCLDIVCAYTNENAWPFANTGKWTVKLIVKTADKAPGFLTDPQFDRSEAKIIKHGIPTKSERDALIQDLINKRACKSAYYDKNIPSV